MGGFIELVTTRENQIAILVAIATMATVVTVVSPLLVSDPMRHRAKRVADYKENLRQQSRAELNAGKSGGLRNRAKEGIGKSLVEQLNLMALFDAEGARHQLLKAGLRGEAPVFTFMLARALVPIIAGLATIFYVYIAELVILGSFMKLMVTIFGFIIGFYLPQIWLSNIITKRQQKISLAFPDSLDLLLICVESGMSIEAALQQVTEEVATTCPELAEEYGLTTAELSYLQDRKVAYKNLGDRTGNDGVKGLVTALIQSETYGTPLGQSLKVMAAESREMRMQAAEKKAAALPPKLTVPMILFFLPVLFVVILAPGAMTAMQTGEENRDQEVIDDAMNNEGARQ